MRILFLTIEYYPELTGVGKSCTLLAESFSSKHFEVLVVVPKKNSKHKTNEVINGVKIKRLGRKKRTKLKILSTIFYPFRLLRIIKIIKEFNPDIIIGETWALEGGVTSGFMGKIFKCTTMMIVQASISAFFNLYKYRKYKRWLYSKAFSFNDIIVGLHPNAKERIEESFRRKAYWVPNCINITPLVEKEDREFLRKKYQDNKNIKINKFNILSVGRLIPVKGYEYLISAMKELDECELYIIGIGPLENNLKQLVEDLKLKNVHFLGQCSNQIVQEYMMVSDLYVSSSLSEGFSIAQLEAMVCGLPLACTPVGAIPTFIEHGVNGFIFNIKKSKEIVHLINYLLKNPNVLEKVRLKAYETVKKKFSCNYIADLYLKIIEEHKNIIKV
ncbi:MAG: glycosyltransferase family 4 protein [Candidatus Heimdallarchaeaceae archaeon]